MAADVRVGAAFEQSCGGDELLVMERDVERRPPRRAAGNGAAPIDGVDVGAAVDQRGDDVGTIRGLAAAGVRPDLCPPRAAQWSAVWLAGIELVGIGARGEQRSNAL